MGRSGNGGIGVVTESNQNRIANEELFHLLTDRVHRIAGLNLEEDDHFLVLRDKDKVIARWSATGVTAEEIRDTTNSYIASSLSALELRLLRFWQRYPRAKLSLYTIAGALDTARTNLRHAITALVEKGILKEQDGDTGLTTYTLAGDRQMQEYIAGLAKFDWSELEISGKKLEGEAVLV